VGECQCKDCKKWNQDNMITTLGLCNAKGMFVTAFDDTCPKAERRDKDGTVGGKR
jgi:hypothetical protein